MGTHTQEPADAFLAHITWKELEDMLVTACQYPKTPGFDGNLEKNDRHHFAEHDAAYVRLPSEHETEPILLFSYGGMTKDWVRQKNKGVFGLFKQGLQTVSGKLRGGTGSGCSPSRHAEEKKYIHQADYHDRWRAAAGPSSQAPVSPTLTFQVKEELPSPEKKTMWRCMEDIEEPAATRAPVLEELGERMASLR